MSAVSVGYSIKTPPFLHASSGHALGRHPWYLAGRFLCCIRSCMLLHASYNHVNSVFCCLGCCHAVDFPCRLQRQNRSRESTWAMLRCSTSTLEIPLRVRGGDVRTCNIADSTSPPPPPPPTPLPQQTVVLEHLPQALRIPSSNYVRATYPRRQHDRYPDGGKIKIEMTTMHRML